MPGAVFLVESSCLETGDKGILFGRRQYGYRSLSLIGREQPRGLATPGCGFVGIILMRDHLTFLLEKDDSVRRTAFGNIGVRSRGQLVAQMPYQPKSMLINIFIEGRSLISRVEP
jgi:hypothetical protein